MRILTHHNGQRFKKTAITPKPCFNQAGYSNRKFIIKVDLLPLIYPQVQVLSLNDDESSPLIVRN